MKRVIDIFYYSTWCYCREKYQIVEGVGHFLINSPKRILLSLYPSIYSRPPRDHLLIYRIYYNITPIRQNI